MVVAVGPERHSQHLGWLPWLPGLRRGETSYVVEPQQVQEPSLLSAVAAYAGARQGGKAPSRRFGGREVALVGSTGMRRPAEWLRARRNAAGVAAGVGVEDQPQLDFLITWMARQGEHGPGGVTRDRTEVALDDEEEVAVGGQQPVELGGVALDQPARTDGVDGAARPGVRQPLDPVPRGQGVGRGQDGDGQELRGMTDGGGTDHRPRHRTGVEGRPEHLDPVDGPQVDQRGQVGLVPVHRQQSPYGSGEVGVRGSERVGRRRHQPQRGRLVAHAVPHEELCATGPHERALLGDGRQSPGLGMTAPQHRALPGR